MPVGQLDLFRSVLPDACGAQADLFAIQTFLQPTHTLPDVNTTAHQPYPLLKVLQY